MDVELARNTGIVAGRLRELLPSCQVQTQSGGPKITYFWITCGEFEARYWASNEMINLVYDPAMIATTIANAANRDLRRNGVEPSRGDTQGHGTQAPEIGPPKNI